MELKLTYSSYTTATTLNSLTLWNVCLSKEVVHVSKKPGNGKCTHPSSFDVSYKDDKTPNRARALISTSSTTVRAAVLGNKSTLSDDASERSVLLDIGTDLVGVGLCAVPILYTL